MVLFAPLLLSTLSSMRKFTLSWDCFAAKVQTTPFLMYITFFIATDLAKPNPRCTQIIVVHRTKPLPFYGTTCGVWWADSTILLIMTFTARTYKICAWLVLWASETKDRTYIYFFFIWHSKNSGRFCCSKCSQASGTSEWNCSYCNVRLGRLPWTIFQETAPT